MEGTPEETWKSMDCSREVLPHLKVQLDVIAPRVVTAGQELKHTFVYAFCPVSGKPLRGTLHRRVKQGATVLMDDVTQPFELKPGTWSVTAFIVVPPTAPTGHYMMATKLEGETIAFENEQPFDVK